MFYKSILWLGMACLALVSSCSSYQVKTNNSQTSALIKRLENDAAASPAIRPDEPSQSLTFEEALKLAFSQNAGIAAANLEIRAAEARALQSGSYPNPEVDLELENVAGTGPLNGVSGVESTLTLSQQILLGGKRKKNADVAGLEVNLASLSYQQRRLDLYAEVHDAFNKLLIAQEDVLLKRESVQLSEKLLASTSKRVKAGKVSSAEASRAQVVLAQNKIALKSVNRKLESARHQLAATWGCSVATFKEVRGEYDLLFALPKLDSLHVLLNQNPDYVRFETELQQRRATIALADAIAKPDPTISGGIRHLNESGDIAFVIGISMPLPFNRNQGGREEARNNLLKSEREKEMCYMKLSSELTDSYNLFQAVQSEVVALQEEIIPQAETAYKRINEGYLQGRFDFLDVLDAERTLFELKDRYLHALREFHESLVRIERLVAQKIH
ncbi:MAG: TolC family protein [Calditrichia bacterium]